MINLQDSIALARLREGDPRKKLSDITAVTKLYKNYTTRIRMSKESPYLAFLRTYDCIKTNKYKQ